MQRASFILPFSLTHGTIIDLETDFDGHPICFGFIHGSKLESYCSEGETNFAYDNLEYLKTLPRPYYAFNKSFEEKVLGISFDLEIQRYQYEKKARAIQVNGLRDPFHGDGYKCMTSWKDYQSSREEFHLLRILDHNVSCLFQEACLVLCSEHRIKW